MLPLEPRLTVLGCVGGTRRAHSFCSSAGTPLGDKGPFSSSCRSRSSGVVHLEPVLATGGGGNLFSSGGWVFPADIKS